jgi:hypothetical protein
MAPILHSGCQWGWIMEFQGRGVVHFHVFIELPLLLRCRLLEPACLQRVSRHGRATDLVRGYLGDLARDSWLADLPGRNAKAEAFNAGGIVELLRTPDAAGRYIAKEAGKRAQKRLPEGVRACGRWWYLNPAFRPKASRTVEVPDVGLPPWRRVFDQDDIRSAALHQSSLPRFNNLPSASPTDFLSPPFEMVEP